MKRIMIALTMAAAAAGGGAHAQRVAAPGGFVPQQAVAFGTAGGDAVAVDAAHPLPVAPQGVAVTYLDRSGAIAVPDTAQTVAPARASRRGFFLQNLSTGDLWIGIGAAATASAPAIRLAAGQLYESPAGGVPAEAISVLGTAAGQSFTAKEW